MSSSCAALRVSSSSSSSSSSDDEEFETDFIDRALKKAKGERTGEKQRLGQVINSIVLAEQRRLCVRHEEAAPSRTPAPARGESGATQEEESARKQGKESTKKEAQRYVVKVVLRFTTKYIAHAHCKWA